MYYWIFDEVDEVGMDFQIEEGVFIYKKDIGKYKIEIVGDVIYTVMMK